MGAKLTLGKEHKLKLFEKWVLRKMFEEKSDDVN
jgi:hypothetical protein